MDNLILYNLLSLFLGVIAWALPVVYLMVGKHRALFCSGSFALCAAALYFQLREMLLRSDRGDFAGIEDTIGAVVFAATVLLVTTVALNALALLRKER